MSREASREAASEQAWIAVPCAEEALRDALRARFARGPFREASAGEPHGRSVEAMQVGDAWIVREQGEGVHRHDFLQRWLTEALTTPTVAQDTPSGSHGARRLEPGGAQGEDAAPFLVPQAWAPTINLAFVVDREKQRAAFAAFKQGLDALLAPLFPISNRARTAEIGRSSHKIYGSNESYHEGIFRYQGSIEMDLKLTLFGPAREEDGMRGPVLDVRRQSLTFARYDLLTPKGAFVERGAAVVIPVDEYAAEYSRSTKAFAAHIRDLMNARKGWEKVTPKTLVDP